MGNTMSSTKTGHKNKAQGEDGLIAINDYPVFPPPPPRALLADRDKYIAHVRFRRHRVPFGKAEDTSLYALYRIYECMVLEHVVGYRNELEWFYREHPDWSVKDISDPQDDDHERYAVLSCIPPLMVMAFNNLIKLGLPRDAPPILSWELVDEYKATPESAKKYEKVPAWTNNVPPLPNELVIPRCDESIPKEESYEPGFKEKNIIMQAAHIFFI
ncbi:MAG: hypothetical protein M1831_007076 [Alyxoria varia]|nr:MAG: hypothetical protein M1831_007076 [Alyxoria varia]